MDRWARLEDNDPDPLEELVSYCWPMTLDMPDANDRAYTMAENKGPEPQTLKRDEEIMTPIKKGC